MDASTDTPQVQNPGNEQVDPVERLLEIVIGKEESLDRLLKLVQIADHKGFLRTLEYLVDEFEELVDAGVTKLATPQVFGLMAAVSQLKEAAKEIEPASLPQVAKGVNGFLHGMANPDSEVEVRGAFDLIKLLKDPDIRMALTAIFSGLKAFGKEIRNLT